MMKERNGTIREYVFDASKKEATDYTIQIHNEFLEKHGLQSLEPGNLEYEQMVMNQIADLKELFVEDETGKMLVDLRRYAFLKQKEAPNTVNPSLWMIGQGNLTPGVYAIVNRDIIQVRGLTPGNITFVRGKTGWIVLDALYPEEVGKAGVILAEKALGENIRDNISAVLITYGVTDCYSNLRGGLKGVLSEDQLKNVTVYAPFSIGAQMTKENIYTNVVNMRRQTFQFGTGQEPGEKGYITMALGLGTPGTMSDFYPTKWIENDGRIEVDGLKIDCQLTKQIGAPPELNLYFQDYAALWVSECLCGILHNIYPLRGAQVRDANAWAGYINELCDKYGDKAVTVFQTSNWAHTNTEEQPYAVRDYLLNSAAAYKYIHDQTLHYAAKGYRIEEIASFLNYPAELGSKMYVRPYYGSIEMGVRGVYQQWIGGYDGNPLNLKKMPKAQEATQFIEYVGSEEKVLQKAVEDYQNGEYQRAAEAADKLVFYNPQNTKAKYLYADALEQLAYQTENSTWRNSYLTGAKELRYGVTEVIPEKDIEKPEEFLKLSENMSVKLMLDYMGICMDAKKAEKEDTKFNLIIIDKQNNMEYYLVHIYQGTLLYSCMSGMNSSYPFVKTKPGLLMALTRKNLSQVKEYIETDDFSILQRLEEYMEDLRCNIAYPIMEPIGDVREEKYILRRTGNEI